METLTPATLDWHTESEPFPSEIETGDRGGVIVDDGHAFAFAIDALGHGPEASRIAARAEEFLAGSVGEPSLENIVRRCHDHMRGTRGLALCVARIDLEQNTLSWLSVGNIQAVRIHLDGSGLPSFESLVMRGGVVGDRLPELRATHGSLNPGDLLVLASDGIDYGWYREFRPDISANELARALMTRHRVLTDDAMVMAIRCHHGGE